MNVTLNGLPTWVDANSTLTRLLAVRALTSQGVAIAVNGEVVRSAAWPGRVLVAGDVVDIVTARQGG